MPQEARYSQRMGLIPVPGLWTPESGCQMVADSGRSKNRLRKSNKNKEILQDHTRPSNGHQDAWFKNVDAFRMTIFMKLRARGKGLARRIVMVVPTCL